MLAVEGGHSFVLGGLLVRGDLDLAGAPLLLARIRGDAQIVEIRLLTGRNGGGIQDEGVLGGRQLDVLAAGVDLMPAVLPRTTS